MTAFPEPSAAIVESSAADAATRISMGHERIDEATAFAVEGKVRADIKTAPLSDINTILPILRQARSKGAWCWI